MKLTKKQFSVFWSKHDKRSWAYLVAQRGWSHDEAEAERKDMLARCGFSSLTLVDSDQGFTRVLEEIAKMRDDIGGILNAQANKRRQKIFLITHKGRPGYWRKIAQDRFGTLDLSTLTDEQLNQLLYTVSDRQVGEHQAHTQRRRSLANRGRRLAAKEDPESRLKLDPPAEQPQNDCGGYYCSEEHGHIDCNPAPAAEPADNHEWLTCSKCGTVYRSDFFCDECEVRRHQAKSNEQPAELTDDVPF